MKVIKTQPGFSQDPDPRFKQRVEITMSPREAKELLEDLKHVRMPRQPAYAEIDVFMEKLSRVTADQIAPMPPCEHCGRAFARWRTDDGKSGWTRRHDPSCAKYASDGVGDVDTMTDEDTP
jgi:hypothetical protein